MTEGQEVVAINLKHKSVLSVVQYTPVVIRRAVIASAMGRAEAKPFQHVDSNSSFISRILNNRVRCIVIYLAKLPQQMAALLKEGK